MSGSITSKSPTCQKIMNFLLDVRIFSLESSYQLKLTPLIISQAIGIEPSGVRKCLRLLEQNKFVFRLNDFAQYYVTSESVKSYEAYMNGVKVA